MSVPHNQAEMSESSPNTEERIAFVFAIKNVLLDEEANQWIPGALQALRMLDHREVMYTYYSNQSDFDDEKLAKKFKSRIAKSDHSAWRSIVLDPPFRYITHNLGYAGKNMLVVTGCPQAVIDTIGLEAGIHLYTPEQLDDPKYKYIRIDGIMVWSRPDNWDVTLRAVWRCLREFWPLTKVFVATEEFEKATDFRYPPTDYWTFYHMVMFSSEWLPKDRAWVSPILLGPWSNNARSRLFSKIYFEFGSLVEGHHPDMIGGLVHKVQDVCRLGFKKIYLITDNFQREGEMLQRHHDLFSTVHRPDPVLEIVTIAKIAGREPSWWIEENKFLEFKYDRRGTKIYRDPSDYQGGRVFPDVLSAVTALLDLHNVPNPQDW